MNWIQPQLGQLLSHSDSGEWGDEDLTNGVSVLRSTNMSNDGTVDFSNLTFRAVPNAKRAAKQLEPGDIILENSGGGPKQPVGRVCYFAGHEMQHIVGNFCRRLRPISDIVLPRFLFWRLHYGHCIGDTLRYQTQTTGLRNLQFKSYLNQAIDVPGKTEQLRIVTILDEAERLRRLSRDANAKAGRILPALFLNMFGDPATNPKGWTPATVGHVLKATDYGTSTKASEDGIGLPVIRMGNVNYAGNLDLRDLKFVNLPAKEAVKYRLEKGDLLFNRTNSIDLVGKTGLWDVALDAVLASYFIRVRVDREQVEPEFLWAYMNSAFMKRTLRATARGAIGQANINTTELRSLPLNRPPLDLQKDFVAKLQAIRRAIPTDEVSAKLEELFLLLLQRAFSGDLTAKWREGHMKELLAEMEVQAQQLNLPMPQEATA